MGAPCVPGIAAATAQASDSEEHTEYKQLPRLVVTLIPGAPDRDGGPTWVDVSARIADLDFLH